MGKLNGGKKVNEKQVKKWAVISIILCYVFLIIPTIVSKVNTWVLLSGEGTLYFVTVEDTIVKIVWSAMVLSLLIALIYLENVAEWFEKTRIGKWVNTPVRGYNKWK